MTKYEGQLLAEADANQNENVFIECYLQVIEHMEATTPTYNQPVHVINIDIQDNHEEATMGAFLIGDLVTLVSFVAYFF